MLWGSRLTCGWHGCSLRFSWGFGAGGGDLQGSAKMATESALPKAWGVGPGKGLGLNRE